MITTLPFLFQSESFVGILMYNLRLFAEDDAQEQFVGTLVKRIAREHDAPVDLRVRSARGGFGKALDELGRFADDCRRGIEAIPDMLVVAVDGNCTGFNDRRDQVVRSAGEALADRLIVAIPDPHIERWFLLDGAAFRTVLGHGCQAPDHKCEKDRYKDLLIQAVQDAGIQPLLRGIEYAEALANEINLLRAAAADLGFKKFVESLRERFKVMAV
jgi:Domain of unknown function (DUF4276)